LSTKKYFLSNLHEGNAARYFKKYRLKIFNFSFNDFLIFCNYNKSISHVDIARSGFLIRLSSFIFYVLAEKYSHTAAKTEKRCIMPDAYFVKGK
jgi:hypothetical protein